MDMFSKKEVATVNYDKQVEPTLLRYLVRIEDVEKEQRSFNRFLERKNLEWESNVSDYKRSIRVARMEIENLKSLKERSKQRFIQLVEEFRKTAQGEDLKILEGLVDSKKFEEYISRDEFMRLVRERIKG